jgi:hypothetical protein
MVARKTFYTEGAEGTEHRKKDAGLKPGATFTDLFYWWTAGSTLPAELPMSAEPRSSNPSMTFRQLVDLYLLLAVQFGQPVALSAFQLPAAETERLFSSYDEDYHISRFFRFSESHGVKFKINGIAATHVSFDSEINSIL